MKLAEQRKAKELRSEGFSLGEIATRLGVSKASVSLWVRNVPVSFEVKKNLQANAHSRAITERRRTTRLAREEEKRETVRRVAAEAVAATTDRDLFVAGVCLYWAEGSKRKRGSVEFSNSDPRLIRLMKLFFTKICKVESEKFRGHVYLHPHLDARKAEKYWSEIAGVPTRQFHKTSQQHNRGSKGKKDNLPYGTFALSIYDTNLFLKIEGWTNALNSSFLSKHD